MIDAAVALPVTTGSSLFPYSTSYRTLVCILLLLFVPVHDASTGLGRLCGNRLNEAMIAICTSNGSTTACFKGTGSFMSWDSDCIWRRRKWPATKQTIRSMLNVGYFVSRLQFSLKPIPYMIRKSYHSYIHTKWSLLIFICLNEENVFRQLASMAADEQVHEGCWSKHWEISLMGSYRNRMLRTTLQLQSTWRAFVVTLSHRSLRITEMCHYHPKWVKSIKNICQ